MAVATDDSSEEETEKNVKVTSTSLQSDKVSDVLPLDASQRATSNLYEPEPRATNKIKVVQEDHLKNAETAPGGEYCPMNGTEMSDYLQPRSDRPASGYLPMGPPPGYDSCVSQHPQVSYENTKNGDPTIDMTDCGMMGYDVPPPLHVYSEIPTNDDEVDDEGNHIYESLDQAKPQ